MDQEKIRGVNLGNWLVLEKWMCPSLFEGTKAEDEYHLTRALTPDIYRERIRRHRREYITEQDFAILSFVGINAVRIPVPYFIFGDRPPFEGCIEELDQAFDWAEKWGLKILIDLHIVPFSQNGFDNGGLSGVCRWATMPEEVDFVLTLLEKLAQRYGQRMGLLGIEPLNEPLTELKVGKKRWEELGLTKVYVPGTPGMEKGSEPIGIPFLRQFYMDAYACIRKYMSPEKSFVFHDAFEMTAWKDFMQGPEYENVIMDTHIYMMQLERQGYRTPDAYQEALKGKIASDLKEMQAYFPIVFGEWCVSNAAANELPEGEEKNRIYRELGFTQRTLWETSAGHFYWSYKLVTSESLDAWDLGKTLSRGWFSLTTP